MNFKTALISSLVVLLFLVSSFATAETSGEFAAGEPTSDENFEYRWVGDPSNNEVSITGLASGRPSGAIVVGDTDETGVYKIVGIDRMAFNKSTEETISIGKNVEFIQSHDAIAVTTFKVDEENDYFTIYDDDTPSNGFYEGKILTTIDYKTVVAVAIDAPMALKSKGGCFPDEMTNIGEGAYNYVDFSEAYDGKTLTIPSIPNIPDYAFLNARFQKTVENAEYTITGLTIPDGVYYIGKDAFRGDYWSETDHKVTLTFGNDIYSIGQGAFNGRDLFKGEIKINATMILDDAFRACDGYISLVFGEKVAYIGQNAFYHNHTLSGTLTIPSTVLYVGPGAFENCDGLSGLDIDAKIISGIYYHGAFQDCDGLATFKLGSHVEYIGDYAFKGCKGITSDHIVFSDKLTYIGDYAFCECKALNGTTLTFNCQPRAIGYHAFDLSGTPVAITVESSGWAKNVFNDDVLGSHTVVSKFVTIGNNSGSGSDISPFIVAAIGIICLAVGVGVTYFYMNRRN